MEPTFTDAALEREFEQRGLVRLDVFDDDEVAEMRAIYRRFHPQPPDGFVSDIDWASRDDKLQLRQQLQPFWDIVIERHLTPHRTLAAGFVVKAPGPRGLLPPHCHFTYVDERRHRSIILWTALDDASEELGNGPVLTLPGSHRVAKDFFGSRTEPWYVPWLDTISRSMTATPTRPGQVLVMDGRLVHGSDVNQSTVDRHAVLCEAVPADAEIFHAVGADDGSVELHRISEDFLIDAEPGAVADVFAFYHAPHGADRAVPEPLVTGDSSGARRLRGSPDLGLLRELCAPDAEFWNLLDQFEEPQRQTGRHSATPARRSRRSLLGRFRPSRA